MKTKSALALQSLRKFISGKELSEYINILLANDLGELTHFLGDDVDPPPDPSDKPDEIPEEKKDNKKHEKKREEKKEDPEEEAPDS